MNKDDPELILIARLNNKIELLVLVHSLIFLKKIFPCVADSCLYIIGWLLVCFSVSLSASQYHPSLEWSLVLPFFLHVL